MRIRAGIMILMLMVSGALIAGPPIAGQSQTVPASQAPPPPEMRVDVNHASLEELLRVPGMTRSWAGRIIRFRPYRTKQDLVDRGVLSGEVYARIKDYIIAHREKQ